MDLPKVPKGSEVYIDYLMELGFGQSDGFGLTNISHQEIESWLNLTGLQLFGWEVKLLKALSSSYVGQFNDKSAKSPFMEQEQQDRIDKIAEMMFFGG